MSEEEKINTQSNYIVSDSDEGYGKKKKADKAVEENDKSVLF